MTLAEIIAVVRAKISLEEARSNRDFWRTGLIAAMLANIHRDTKKKGEPFKIEDFMPVREKKRSEMTPEEMFNVVRVLNQTFGGDTWI